MVINSKALGGMLLIIGTSIGAGMLALPLALAQVGFEYSLILLVVCWFVMYLGARLLLEVNLKSAPGSHLVSMAKQSLGWPGQLVAWIACLALFYSLLAGYIAGGSDVLKTLLMQTGWSLPDWISTVVFTVGFGLVVYSGIRSVDYVNRGLMFGKLGVFVLLVGMTAPRIQTVGLTGGELQAIPASLMILITSFGFASIVPSLRLYFQDDVSTLRRVLFWGSVIPLLCYMIWNAVMMGVLPSSGEHSLMALAQSNHPVGGMIHSLEQQVGSGWFSACFNVFTSICMLTAFLGVSLGLFDFLADGLSCQKKGVQGWMVYACTFFPPMLLVLLYPGIYLSALRYAGRCCVVLLLMLPAGMAWQWHRNRCGKAMVVPGGAVGIGFVLVFGTVLLFLG
ncbi:MAG: tryptophan/tyrosine permease [Gammaproteobacteria bacterium]|nr:tryptophan/tyrosine permease [Gammaproteobacteria bacterium]